MHFVNRATFCAVPLILAMAFNAAGTQYGVFTGFPKAAPGAFGVQAVALPDGRWVVWNGDAVFLETMVGGDEFKEVASGYAGDPGFMAVSPDGHHVLLGAGYSGKLYVLDTNAPADYSPGSEVATVTHYYGVCLTESLVLLDRATDDNTTSELVVLDLSSPSPTHRRVMSKPPNADLNGTEYGVSACLAVNASHTMVYTTGLVYDGWDLVSNQLKKVTVAALVNAYQTSTPLDWNIDAFSIGASGAFGAGGPAGISASEELFIGGFGGVQRVDPAMGTVIETIDPAGPFEYYGVAYNPRTGVVLPIVADPADWSMDVVYAPEDAFAPLPAGSGLGLLALAAMLAVAGAGRAASRRIG